MKKRLFIAVKIIAEENLHDLTENLKNIFNDETINWVNNDNLHLTLKFLGNTDVLLIPVISNLLETVAKSFSPFMFNLKGLGYFGSKCNPQVVFVRIENHSVLKSISSCINSKLSDLGIEEEKKEFNAHLTLGRIKFVKKNLQFLKEIEKYKDVNFQEIKIDELILYESILTSEGPIYKIQKKFSLKK